jgi:hypothetical protein
MRKILPAIFCLIYFSFSARSQSPNPSVVSSAGGEGKTASTWLTWTVGEPVVTTATAATKIYTQGFNQPVLMVKDREPITVKATVRDLNIGIAPNPVRSMLTVRIVSKNDFRVEVQLTAADGKSLFNRSYSGKEVTAPINMSGMSSGMYLLSFYDASGLIKTFEIIKN